ncbi:MAG TPA: SIMPL domain-containing protein [Allosphingosinicella sp.]|nr:SIMPL domain-containing protein [Allosphingosinicella sp.]
MRRFASTLLLCLPLAACGPAPADPRGVGRDEVLVQIVASGRADTRPDEARFTAGVQTIAASAAAASTGNNGAMNRVTAALERIGVKPDDMQTRSITLARIDYGRDRGRFQANNMIEVRVRDLKRAGAAIAAATEAGANILSGPNLAIADPEAASRSAYARAYRAARARAEAYAAAAGLKVARVLAIRDAGDGAAPPPLYGEGAAMDAVAQTAAPPPLRAGLTTSEVRVRTDFALAAD